MKAILAAFGAGACLIWTLAVSVATAGGPSIDLVRVPHDGIQPEAVIDTTGTVHLLYFAGEPRAGDLYYVRSTDYGRTFSTPIRVNSQQGSAIATGTIRGGQLAIGRGGRVHVVWNGSDEAKPRGLVIPASGRAEAPFLYARLNTSGTAFEPQRDLARRSYGVDGGGSIAADATGDVFAAWHALPVGGANGEEHRLVWIARSTDDGATFGEETPAWKEPTGACGCCGLRLFAGPSNILYGLYRSATALTHRDIFLLESTDRGRSFRGSRVQKWEIGACPMTSMSMASSSTEIFGAWETAGQVYFGAIDPKGARIPTSIAAPGDAGTRKHPRLAVNANGNVLFVWTEGTAWSRGGSLAWQAFDGTGSAIGPTGASGGIAVWSFAAPIARPDGSFAILY
ncbi:MAG TPA: sialidase family protein [Vicinamibacterales bacterium]|nr:sialidase family protein [Vicinamibacterales bacterium]